MLYLFFFNNNEEYNLFINKINEKLEIQINFENNIYVKNIQINKKPKWFSDIYYNHINDINIKNILNYRIVFYKFNHLILYIEINGQYKKLNNIFKDFIYEKNIIIKNNINNIEDLNNEINNYILCKSNIRKEEIANINSNIISINDLNDYSVNNILIYYNDLYENKQLDNDKKISKYIKTKNFDNNKKSSETIYNKLICENQPDKYLNLDKKYINSCEIADIYDIENNLLFHNKKYKDLRVLSFQIINGALQLKNNDSLETIKFINENKIANGYKYVFGIIKDLKSNISMYNKLALGCCCYILNKLNIDYYIDIIEFIDK
jgi:hypothetical protein